MRYSAIVRVTRLTLAIVLCFLAAMTPRGAAAQVLRGHAKTLDGARPVERAQVIAMNLTGQSIGNTTTDDQGRFHLRLDSHGAPFVVSVKRIGMQPTTSDRMMLANVDTLEVQFLVTEVGIYTDTIRVTATPPLNELRLIEAKHRGYRVFAPTEIAARRETSFSFSELIRSLGYPGLVVGNRPGDCIRNTRNNGCMTLVIDGMPIAGGDPALNPRDIYFVAVLTASQASVQYGDKAPWGAIQIVTRMRGDKYEK